jgi:hypothetical protein
MRMRARINKKAAEGEVRAGDNRLGLRLKPGY